jgi:hypothetical protein
MTCVLIVKCLMLLFFKVKCSNLITDIKYWIIYKDNNGISDKNKSQLCSVRMSLVTIL